MADVDFGVRFNSERVGHGGDFWASPVWQSGELEDVTVYLWLAQKANHPAREMKLDGLTITVERGAWFCSIATLAAGLRVSRARTLRILSRLKAIGAITVESVTRPQRYRNGTVNGSKSIPFNGAKLKPQRSGNDTDVRCLGTLVKVLGWREIAARDGNGIKTRLQEVLNTSSSVPRDAGRSTAARRSADETFEQRRLRENAEAIATLEREEQQRVRRASATGTDGGVRC